ncbi:BglG family transcription antiterminator [Streptococcus sciuri]|uniref:Transcription antiterminator n=1 Tax=Streptococcus sciuri TaxID=2973939 RepID=A0ABT2F687_9STRE|nr:transcription antiterminator [Streptococcus sciuri]MCS4488005.1 transcription antiterminator [Streptococcus sciuri]
MIVLDKKSSALLSYLISLDEPETVMAISKHLGQSRRKIYYHLDKINESLSDDVEKIVSFPRVGIVLSENQKKACQKLLKELDAYSYVMSSHERICLLLIYIAVADSRVTLEKLMQLTEVSRNTVLNDLNSLRERLSLDQYNVKIHVTKTRGYYLEAHPLAKMQFVHRTLYNIYTTESGSFQKIMHDKIVVSTGYDKLFSQPKLDYLRQLLDESKKELGKKLNTQDSAFMFNILPYLLMSYRNMVISSNERKRLEKEFLLAKERIEYHIAERIAKDFEERFHVAYDDVEISIIAMLLLSFRKDKDSHNGSSDFDAMRNVIKDFLDDCERTYHVSFEHKDELNNQLLTHCKALLYRKTYGIFSLNPMTEQVKSKYGNLFAMTKSCAHILEDAWFIRLNDDDIAYLTIHLGGALYHIGVQDHYQPRLILVCDEGIGSRKFLLKQCQRYIPQANIEAVFTSEQFNSVRDIVSADAVIATSDGIETKLPMLVVNSVLTNDDIIRLVSFVYSNGKRTHDDLSQDLDQLLGNHIKDESERYVLRNQLEKVFRDELLRHLK